jgi:hypothetical protein
MPASVPKEGAWAARHFTSGRLDPMNGARTTMNG